MKNESERVIVSTNYFIVYKIENIKVNNLSYALDNSLSNHTHQQEVKR